MLPNEVFALECLAKYAREGLVVDSSNGQFAHCPYPKPREQKWRLPGDLGYYLTFFDHQHQGLLQSVDVGRRCYFAPDVKLYLDTYPPNYFELYDIYDKFNLHTEESKLKMSRAIRPPRVPRTEAQREAISERMSGEKHPLYGKFGSLHPNSKAVIITLPDGTKLHFGSVIEAATWSGIPYKIIGRYLKSRRVLKRGKCKNWRFEFAE